MTNVALQQVCHIQLEADTVPAPSMEAKGMGRLPTIAWILRALILPCR